MFGLKKSGNILNFFAHYTCYNDLPQVGRIMMKITAGKIPISHDKENPTTFLTFPLTIFELPDLTRFFSRSGKYDV